MTGVHDVDLPELLGQTFTSVERLPGESVRNPMVWWRDDVPFESNEVLIFTRSDGVRYVMGHDQWCCERVDLNDINGDLSDMCGSPIVLADEAVSPDDPSHAPDGWNEDEYKSEHDGRYRWSFYRLATVKGYVDIRWFGGSNGYYSETVSIYRVEPGVELRT